MKKKVKAILWDLDETLADTRKLKKARDSKDWLWCYDHLNLVKMYTGIDDDFEALQRKLKQAIITSSPKSYAKKILSAVDLIPDVLVAYHDTTFHKPDPAPLLKAIEILGVEPIECVAIGDTVTDLVASVRAGTRFIGVSWGEATRKEFKLAGALIVVDTPEEILKYLAS